MNTKTRLTILKNTIISLLIIMTALLSGCNYTISSPESCEKSGMFFDTFITISIYDRNDPEILNECFRLCSEYENMLSATINGSDIDRINSSNGAITPVSYDTYKLIEDSIYYSEISDGLFDISIYPVYSLWDFRDSDARIPNDSDIQDALTHVNYNNIVLNSEQSVKLSDKSSAIELGGIAKGYIADMLADYLKKCNISSAIINIGGDIHVIGAKSNNTPFVIGIKDPNNTQDVLCALKINDICVATSGTYERSFEYEGKIFHHILNPKTGYPADTDIKSVTVITDSSEKADALCTCLILFGSQRALDFIENEENTEAIIVTNNNITIKSSGASKYIITSQ